MRKKFEHIVYSFFSHIYYYFLIVLGLGIMYILSLYRWKIIALLGSNLLSFYFGSYIFYISLVTIFYLVYELIFKAKNKFFGKFRKYKKPTYIETYGEDYKMPNFEEFSLTKQEYQKNSHKSRQNVNVMQYQKSLKIYHNIQRELYEKKYEEI